MISVAQKHIFCWMYGNTERDKVRNVDHTKVGIAPSKRRCNKIACNSLITYNVNIHMYQFNY